MITFIDKIQCIKSYPSIASGESITPSLYG